MQDPKFFRILSDRRIRCMLAVLTNKNAEARCKGVYERELIERWARGDVREEDLEKFIDLLKSLGMDVEIANKLIRGLYSVRDKMTDDLKQNLSIVLFAITGHYVNPSEFGVIDEIIEAFKCVKEEEGELFIDYTCMEEKNIRKEIVDTLAAGVGIGSLVLKQMA